MSLKINADNLYLILPSNVSFKESNIGGSMEKDFTLFARVKIDKEKLTEKESFIISRSGMHSGISVFKNQLDKVFLQYTYWFENEEDGTKSVKQVHVELKDSDMEDFVDLYMINDDDKAKISCYLNGNIVGSIVYSGFNKLSYKDSPFWIGCGSMFGDEDTRGIGDFEYEIIFCSSKKILNLDVQDIIKNYDSKYSKNIFGNYKIFNPNLELTKYFAFFCDFKISNRYKLWNYAFNGNYPQIYIEGNVYY
jgi:hypothetical protein